MSSLVEKPRFLVGRVVTAAVLKLITRAVGVKTCCPFLFFLECVLPVVDSPANDRNVPY